MGGEEAFAVRMVEGIQVASGTTGGSVEVGGFEGNGAFSLPGEVERWDWYLRLILIFGRLSDSVARAGLGFSSSQK